MIYPALQHDTARGEITARQSARTNEISEDIFEDETTSRRETPIIRSILDDARVRFRDELSAAASRSATARHGVMPETGDSSHGYSRKLIDGQESSSGEEAAWKSRASGRRRVLFTWITRCCIPIAASSSPPPPPPPRQPDHLESRRCATGSRVTQRVGAFRTFVSQGTMKF